VALASETFTPLVPGWATFTPKVREAEPPEMLPWLLSPAWTLEEKEP
jgi:hypothetical protein